MPTNSNDEPANIAEFNLKHRVTGAAVLLFIGAAVLPWLLGPPSEASKVEPQVERVSVTELSAEVVAADLLVDGASSIDIEETVYISKITPLDANKQSALREAAEKAATISADVVNLSPEKPDSKSAAVLDEGDAAEKAAEEAKLLKQRAAKKAAEQKKREAAAIARSNKEKQDNDAVAAALKAKIAKEKLNSSVDVGWVVQVGLFTEKNRAIAFISELKNKGFDASSNVVDTNRGKNTGTRVWLGPFARKSNAANELKRLKAKAGKDGFIRVYP